jgi:L-seryl-tRNA(Ser) seleniumtransferase
MVDLTLPGAGEASGSTGRTAAASFAALPSVDRLLGQPAIVACAARHGLPLAKRAINDELAAQREAVRSGAAVAPLPALIDSIERRVATLAAPTLRRVINLTGTVIHTNLGRALLAEEAIEAVAEAMRGYAALEYDLTDGGRGDRDDLVEDLLRELTGAEAATVVNNNAAAVVLALAALAARKEVLVSRGELIEIGGAFRMPDIMKTAGCRLVEVGTTNRTHGHDFEGAITPRSGLIVKAHTSNYAVQGFTAGVDDATLARIAHARGLPYMVDLGSGALVDLSRWGLPKEPLPQESLAAGADVVTFSGDKLLGGPQAGILVGTGAAIGRIKRHPLKRALRCSKMTLAALEATLRIYRSGHRLDERLPTLALLSRPAEDIRAAAERLQPAMQAFAGEKFVVGVAACASQIGSGALPVERLPSFALHVVSRARRGGRALEELAQRLRAAAVPVLGRINDDALWLDCRTLLAADEAALQAQLALAGEHRSSIADRR